MLKNYLNIAIRNLMKYRGHSLVNIAGLSIGMACCILIIIYVRYEISYDKFNENYPDIRRVIIERNNSGIRNMDITLPPPLAEAMKNEYPWIKQTVRFLRMDNPVPLVSNGMNKFYENQLLFCDPEIFRVFTSSFVSGNPLTALTRPNTTIITEKTSLKYFGSQNPIGKKLTINNNLELEITGVTKSMPTNSTIQYDLLISFSTLNGWLGTEFINDWHNNLCQTYFLVSKNISDAEWKSSFSNFIKKYQDKSSSMNEIHLQPLEKLHLYSLQEYNIATGGDIGSIYLLIIISILVLLIACFNFTNLITLQLINRSKEIGIRKISGASRKQTIFQIMSECAIIPFLSLVISVILVEISLPFLSRILEIQIDFLSSLDTFLIPGCFVFLMSSISGLYPAFMLSSIKSISVLKGFSKPGSKGFVFRKAIVMVQYMVTIILIIGSCIIYSQVRYIQDKNMGFEKDGIMVIPIRNENLRQNPESLKNRLRTEAGVLQVGGAALLPGGPTGKIRYKSEGMNNNEMMSMLWVDQDFNKTLGMEIIAGRDFSKEFSSDKDESFIINEEALRHMGLKTPAEAIGKSFEIIGGKKGNIIGVVKDFHYTSLYRKIEPAVLYIWPWLNYILVKPDMNRFSSLLNNIQKIWNEFDPTNPFTYTFLKDNLGRYYTTEKRLEKLAGFFTMLALILAGLGLFSISAFTIKQRKKEIGIRKVCGASTGAIVFKLNMEFTKWILLANLFSLPLAWYIMNNWLEKFAYRISLDPWVFLTAGFVTFLISFCIVSYNGVKSAKSNPVDSLRYE
jgi:putative ABC transport system permease protein